MPTGAITEYIDVAQVVLYAFWIFFAFLILYLRREDKREGYPLESDRAGGVSVVGFPAMPAPKVFRLADGSTHEVPSEEPPAGPIAAEPTAPWPGAPLEPTGNPLLDGVGPAAFAARADHPEPAADGAPRIVPIRVATDFTVESRDPDPRGMEVVGADGGVAGTVSELWVDRSEPQLRYLEVEISTPVATRNVLLPITLARIDAARRQVKVASILAGQFMDVPGLRDPDQVTQLEEDRICAYYGGGHLFARPSRRESLL